MNGPDTRSAEAKAYRSLYTTPNWRRLRKRRLAAEPNCRSCTAIGRTTPAVIADHVKPHRGDRTLFFDFANTQSLCETHHSSHKQRQERGGRALRAIGPDGWPVEPPDSTASPAAPSD